MSEPFIGSSAWESRDRIGVYNMNLTGDGDFGDSSLPRPWAVVRGYHPLNYFPTHAEAIEYADREARRL